MKQSGAVVRPQALNMWIVDEKPSGQLTLKFRTFDFAMTCIRRGANGKR